MLQVEKSPGSPGPEVGTKIEFAGIPGVYLVVKVSKDRITCRRTGNSNNKP